MALSSKESQNGTTVHYTFRIKDESGVTELDLGYRRICDVTGPNENINQTHLRTAIKYAYGQAFYWLGLLGKLESLETPEEKLKRMEQTELERERFLKLLVRVKERLQDPAPAEPKESPKYL